MRRPVCLLDKGYVVCDDGSVWDWRTLDDFTVEWFAALPPIPGTLAAEQAEAERERAMLDLLRKTEREVQRAS